MNTSTSDCVLSQQQHFIAPPPPKRVCVQWHALTREEQAKYYELARKERQLHMQLYPTWSARDNYVRTIFSSSFFFLRHLEAGLKTLRNIQDGV